MGRRLPGRESFGVFARRSTPGAPAPPSSRVDTYTTGLQASPAASADAAGNLVVVWKSYGQDGSGEGIFAQRYDASGAPQGGGVPGQLVHHRPPGAPDMARDPGGSFVVVWQGLSLDRRRRLFAQRYDASGIPAGQVPHEWHDQRSFLEAAVATSEDGDFVVAWMNAGDGPASDGILRAGTTRRRPSRGGVPGELAHHLRRAGRGGFGWCRQLRGGVGEHRSTMAVSTALSRACSTSSACPPARSSGSTRTPPRRSCPRPWRATPPAGSLRCGRATSKTRTASVSSVNGCWPTRSSGTTWRTVWAPGRRTSRMAAI